MSREEDKGSIMIGKNIYELRKNRGFSLSELSDKSGISKSYLSNIERNLNKNPSIQILEKISIVLKVDLKALINQDNDFDKTLQLDNEWIELISELKKSGLEKESLNEFRQLIDFIKWKSQNK